jgi:hypothetical protein
MEETKILKEKIKTSLLKHLTEELSGVNNINDNFWRWFRNSKIVNNDGSPLIVYHGTPNRNLSKFKLDFVGSNTDSGMFGRGFYFTDSLKYASTYNRSNGGVLSCFLSIQNPLIINNKNDIPKITVPDETIDDMYKSSDNYSEMFRTFLINNGYDGVIDNLSQIKQFVALYPNQIKSIKNNGDWSLNNDNIYL